MAGHRRDDIHRTSVEHEGQRLLGRPGHREEENIEVDFKEVGFL